MTCYCDYEPADFYSATMRKARKEHRCEECGSVIKPGQQYEHAAMGYEGTACAYKTCQHCLEVRRFVKSFVPCFCWAHGNLLADAQDTARGYAHEADGLLFGTLRRIVIARRSRREAAA